MSLTPERPLLRWFCLGSLVAKAIHRVRDIMGTVEARQEQAVLWLLSRPGWMWMCPGGPASHLIHSSLPWAPPWLGPEQTGNSPNAFEDLRESFPAFSLTTMVWMAACHLSRLCYMIKQRAAQDTELNNLPLSGGKASTEFGIWELNHLQWLLSCVWKVTSRPLPLTIVWDGSGAPGMVLFMLSLKYLTSEPWVAICKTQ